MEMLNRLCTVTLFAGIPRCENGEQTARGYASVERAVNPRGADDGANDRCCRASVVYIGSKHASMTKTDALEVGVHLIRVNAAAVVLSAAVPDYSWNLLSSPQTASTNSVRSVSCKSRDNDIDYA